MLLFTMLAACTGNGNDTMDDNMDTPDAAVDESKQKMDENTRKIFYAIPSPLEMAVLIKNAGAVYNADLLNPIDNRDKYATSYQQALNLGIYGADLSYTSMFDQAQESLLYLSCVRKLSEMLGISGAFDDQTVDRLERNKDNRDSVMEIISDAYWTSDSYLKESERYNMSCLVIAGGWIEGLYVSSQLANQAGNNEQIKSRISDQHSSLQNLIGLLEANKEDEKVNEILLQLVDLDNTFKKNASGEVSAVTTETDNNAGVTTINGGGTPPMDNATLKMVSEKIASIRNGIIQVN